MQVQSGYKQDRVYTMDSVIDILEALESDNIETLQSLIDYLRNNQK